ncbi:ABC transporter substrate-binding protein [Lacisediminimonas profundi]|uniref:ABC transporter substrate-binding protein n=1 Tax=Lacisediminimonas profundi TaxID=2603856 RepID=UPI00124BB293|nr:ABC transporter substrate-binding protein [Lacisediminimonas profundi]
MFKTIRTSCAAGSRLLATVAAATALTLGAGSAIAQETWKFGIANDLSGPSSYHGKTFAGGFNTYLKEVNDAGGMHGKKLELLQENAERNVQKEVGFLRKFAQQDKVLAAMMVTSDGLFAAKPLTESLKVPLTGIGVPELASNPVHPWLFNIVASYQDTVFAAIDHVFNGIGDKDPKIAVIAPDSQFGLEAVRAAELRMQKYGKPLTSKVVMALKDTDATTQVLALKQAGVKYVIIQLAGAHVAAILRDANKVGLDATFFGTTQAMDREPDLILSQPNGAALSKKFIGVGPWSKWNETSIPGVAAMRIAARKLEDVPEAKLGSLMYSNFVQGYVTAMVMAEALKKAGPAANGEKMRDALQQIKNFDTRGITPPLSFGPDRHKGSTGVKLFRINADSRVYEPIGGWVTPN